MSPPAVAVVGAGGLLGSAVLRHLHATGHPAAYGVTVPWNQPSLARAALTDAVATLAERAAGGPWQLLWCAGAGVVASDAGVFADERAAFGALLEAVTDRLGRDLSPRGVVFLASSAGAVYAGSATPPFDEHTVPVPLAAYGEAKLLLEGLAHGFADRTGVPVLVGRIANLYGPGQDLGKAQGLVSHLCRTYLTGQPVSVYVSLDTIRDYLYVDDAAALITDAAAALGADGRPGVVTKIVCSGQGVTIGALIGAMRAVFKRAPRVVLGASPFARAQSRDLRLRSVVWTELDRRSRTTLPAGIRATAEALLAAPR